MRKAVCLILRKDNKFLAVSRKDNHQLFGLVGGKVEFQMILYMNKIVLLG